MDEKQLTFEMDDSHVDSMKKIIGKYKTIEPKARRNKRSNCKQEELLKYIAENQANTFIASLNPTDLIDLPDIATRIMEYFSYQTIVLETPYGSKSRTVLVMSRWGNGFLITLQDATKEYTNWYNWNKTLDKSPTECNAFPSYTQFMAIYCYYIENMLKAPNGRNQQSFSCVTGYIFRQLAALYLYKKYKNKVKIDWAGKSTLQWSHIWQTLLNFFQVGSLSNVAKFASNGFLVGGLCFSIPGYTDDNITDTTIRNLMLSNDIDKNNAKLLIDLLSGQKVDHLKKILWLIGKVMLGDYFVRQLCSKESHLTIIQYHKPNLIAACLEITFKQVRAVLFKNTNVMVLNYNSNLALSNIEQRIANQLAINANEIFGIAYNDIVTTHIFHQINGVQAYIITEPDTDKPIRNLDFYKDLFSGDTVTYEGAYDKTIGQKVRINGKEEAQQLHYTIPGGLNYTCNAQTILITKEKSAMASKLSDAKKTDINYIDIDWDLTPLEDFINKQSITPIVAGKLAMLSMVYMMNKLCLGIDAFDTVAQSTASICHEEKTESEYIGEFYADCIKDFTGNLDPAKIIKDTEAILKENNKSYDEIDWTNTEGAATKVRDQDELKDLLTVTSSDLLAAYKAWKSIKKIDPSKPTWKKFSEELLSHLNIMQNQELVKYKKIFLCRKLKSQYTQAETNASKSKTNASKAKTKPREQQPTGMLGIQLNKTWSKKLTNEKDIQEVQEKEKYEKVLSLLEAQFDDAMKEIQSFKIPPQPYMP